MLRASSKAFFFVSCFNLKTTTTDKNSWEGLKKWLDFNMSTIIENISANVVLHGPPLLSPWSLVKSYKKVGWTIKCMKSLSFFWQHWMKGEGRWKIEDPKVLSEVVDLNLLQWWTLVSRFFVFVYTQGFCYDILHEAFWKERSLWSCMQWTPDHAVWVWALVRALHYALTGTLYSTSAWVNI